MTETQTAGPTAPSPYAGFWLRVVAYLIDGLILAVPTILIVLFVYPALMPDGGSTSLYSPASFLLAGLWWIYFAGLESSEGQASLGKRTVNIIVTDLKGQRVPFYTASLRAWPMYVGALAAGFASFADKSAETAAGLLYVVVSLLAFISCVVVAFSRRKQGFHDMMVNCLVIRKSAVPSPGGA